MRLDAVDAPGAPAKCALRLRADEPGARCGVRRACELSRDGLPPPAVRVGAPSRPARSGQSLQALEWRAARGVREQRRRGLSGVVRPSSPRSAMSRWREKAASSVQSSGDMMSWFAL